MICLTYENANMLMNNFAFIIEFNHKIRKMTNELKARKIANVTEETSG